MRHDSDFADYTAARWTSLVRSLVMLGSPPWVAAETALSALARCYPHWEQIREVEDLDVHVYRLLLECRDHGRDRWWEDDRAVEPGPVEPGPVAVLPPVLEAALDRLRPLDRQVLVLRVVADLAPEQVAAVLGVSLDTVRGHTSLPEELIREAAEAIVLPAPEVEAVRVRARHQRRRPRLPAVAVAVAILVVLAFGTWLGTRPAEVDDTVLSAVPVQRQENPAGLTWFANGRLHLAHVTVELGPVLQIATVSGGAVYGDSSGAVVLVGEDGARRLLGHKVAGIGFVDSDERGWVVWVDPSGGTPELVVHDLGSGSVLAREELSGPAADSHPIAIDQDWVYYSTPQGDRRWQPLTGDPEPVEPGGLLDVASATRVSQADPESISMVQPLFDSWFASLGRGARLSADGNYVLTRIPDERSVYGTVRIYDTRTGEEISNGLAADELAIAAELGADRTVTYVVARDQDKPAAEEFVRLSFSGPLELRTCSFDTGRCVVDARFPSTGSTPLLAR